MNAAPPFNRKSVDPETAERLGQELLVQLQRRTTNMDKVRSLIEQGAKIDARDSARNTPLHGAVGKRHFEAAKLLLEAGANPNAISENGMFPLMWTMEAHAAGSAAIAQLLIDHGANTGQIYNDRTPLMWAADGGYPDIAAVLAPSSDIMEKSRGRDPKTAVDYAEQANRPEIADMLRKTHKQKEIDAIALQRKNFDEAVGGMATRRNVSAPRTARFRKTPVSQQ
jgi:ankyrin repeat protein